MPLNLRCDRVFGETFHGARVLRLPMSDILRSDPSHRNRGTGRQARPRRGCGRTRRVFRAPVPGRPKGTRRRPSRRRASAPRSGCGRLSRLHMTIGLGQSDEPPFSGHSNESGHPELTIRRGDTPVPPVTAVAPGRRSVAGQDGRVTPSRRPVLGLSRLPAGTPLQQCRPYRGHRRLLRSPEHEWSRRPQGRRRRHFISEGSEQWSRKHSTSD